MLPPLYYHVHYDKETGEILSFINPFDGDFEESPTIMISAEEHASISGIANRYRVVNESVVEREGYDLPAPIAPLDIGNALIAGFMRDGVCFAISPAALSVLQLDLAANAKLVRAVVHTKDGNELVELDRKTAASVATDIAGHVATLHCG